LHKRFEVCTFSSVRNTQRTNGSIKVDAMGNLKRLGSIAAVQGRELDVSESTAMADNANFSTVPDWSRERPVRFWDPPRRLLRSIRSYQWARDRGRLFWPVRVYHVLTHRFWSIATAADVPLNVQIEGGCMFPHPTGVVIAPDARIGVNCLISQGVTIGTRGASGSPKIGGGVYLGAGAKVLGPISIGDQARVGANAVVLCDVPAGATAVGVPARIVGA
jgi:serine O-acetyltransferase